MNEKEEGRGGKEKQNGKKESRGREGKWNGRREGRERDNSEGKGENEKGESRKVGEA